MCLPTVVAEFSRLVARLGLMDCAGLLPQRSQAMRPQRPLEMFFPFDPYLLRRSAQVRPLCKNCENHFAKLWAFHIIPACCSPASHSHAKAHSAAWVGEGACLLQAKALPCWGICVTAVLFGQRIRYRAV